MRIKRDYSNFPIEYQIKRLNFRIRFLKIFSIIWSVFIIVVSVVIWIFTPVLELALSFLITLPLSIYIGGYLQIKEYKKEIEKLHEKTVND